MKIDNKNEETLDLIGYALTGDNFSEGKMIFINIYG